MGSLRGWRFCPRCAAPLDAGPASASCPACGASYYAHSHATASALVVDGAGRVLLGRRAVEPERGKWDLPGGFVEEGEHPRDAAVRELREETGLEIEPVELLAIELDRYGDADDAPWTLNLYWTARAGGGEPRADDDVEELRWFAPAELPPVDALAFRVNARVLERWRDGASK